MAQSTPFPGNVGDSPDYPVGEELKLSRPDPPAINNASFNPDKVDRELQFDLQRRVITHTYDVRGRPDVATRNGLLAAFEIGKPHPWNDSPELPNWFTSFYVINTRWSHESFGGNEDETDRGQAWTKVVVTYQQRACPGMYEERWRIATTSYSEWYGWVSDPATQVTAFRLLTSRRDPIQVLKQTPIVTRSFPKVVLSKAIRRTLRQEAGLLNGDDFLGEGEQYWMFDGAVLDHLWGDPDADTAAYAVTLVFRGDPYRHHAYYTFRPDDKGTFQPTDPLDKPTSWTYDDFHLIFRRYPIAATRFDDLIPTNPDLLTPEDGTLP